MAQPDILTCRSSKGKGILVDEVNGIDQTQCNASVESWLNQVKSALESRDKMWKVSTKVCIYKVPKSLMVSNQEAYVPFVVSLGPYHHKVNPKFSMMDQHKLEAVHRTLARLKIDMVTLIEEIQQLESDVRKCYEEPVKLDGETFSYMLAMDASFILEFLRWESCPDDGSLVFGYYKSNSTSLAIQNDIMKLENQIPLFLLIKILQLEWGTVKHAITTLAAILSQYHEFRGFPFSLLQRQDTESKLKKYMMNERPPCHLLDLYRMVIRDHLTNSSAESATSVEIEGHGDAVNVGEHMNTAVPSWIQRLNCMNGCDIHRWRGWSTNVRLPGWIERIHLRPCFCRTRLPDDRRSIPSAQLLRNAGIKFQRGPLRFEKSWFGRGTLYLPHIEVWDRTETLLRNLMAYEECQRGLKNSEDTAISHFVILLDNLIDSEKDVSVLRKSLVIENFLGSDENITSMFNRICYGITLDPTRNFELVTKEATDHYNSQWKVWISEFKIEHFSKPWYILSIAAAILILGMTAVQTVLSVKK